MTNREARRKGHAGGHVVQLGWSEGFTLYLTDYREELDREDGTLTTPYPGGAEWFGYLPQAREAAARMRHATGQPWVVTTAPAAAKPCRCHTDAQYAYPCNVPCPDCGSARTAKIADHLRCFMCGNAWQAEPSYGPEDDGLTDAEMDRIMSSDLEPGITPDEAEMCFREALKTVKAEGVTS